MKRLLIGTSLAAIIGLTSGAVWAKPDNAADTESGLGCWVRADSNVAYTYDADCEYHYVRKADQDGVPQIASYHDHGTLPAGTEPTRATHNTIDTYILVNGQWAHCTGKEIATPSGDYRSDCRIEH